jgi:hypothetical protein
MAKPSNYVPDDTALEGVTYLFGVTANREGVVELRRGELEAEFSKEEIVVLRSGGSVARSQGRYVDVVAICRAALS